MLVDGCVLQQIGFTHALDVGCYSVCGWCCRAESRLDGIKKRAFSHLAAAGSRLQGYDVGGRLAEGCMEGCYDSEGALGAQEVGKASANLLSRHCVSCPDDIGCSWYVAFTAWQPRLLYRM